MATVTPQPLDLAIALLTDAQGKIDVAVPVHGNLDNPKFKYGHVIRQAIINLITKIMTAPFRALDVTRVTAGSSGPVEKASRETVNTKLTLDVIKN